MSELEEYYNKYMKYKMLYLNLQSKFDKINIQHEGGANDKVYCNSILNDEIKRLIENKGINFKNPIKFLKKFMSELEINIPLILEKRRIDPIQLDIKLIATFIIEVLEDIKIININTLEEKRLDRSWITERDSSTSINCYLLNILVSKFMSLLKFQNGCNHKPTTPTCKKCDDTTCKKLNEDADAILRDLEKYNSNKYFPDLGNTKSMNVPVRKMAEDILTQILKLQDKQFVHCNINLSNITGCYSSDETLIFKLINWYNGIYTKEYVQDMLYKNNYVTDQIIVSPLLVFNDVCNTLDDYQRKFVSNMKQFLNTFGIVDTMAMSSENIRIFLAYLNNTTEFNKIEVIYRYHIDLYAFGIVLYQLANKNIQVINKMRKVVDILRYTIKTTINNENIMMSEFKYFGIEDRKVYSINLGDLLNEIAIGLIFTRNL